MSPTGPDRESTPPAGGRVLLVLPDGTAPRTARVAASVAAARGADLVVLRAGPAPPDAGGRAEEAVAGAVAVPWNSGSSPDLDVVDAGRDERPPVDAAVAAADRHDADLVVAPGGPATGLDGGAAERLYAAAPCDVAVVGGRTPAERVASVLVPVAGGPHSRLAVDVAGSLAAATGAWVDVLHVVDPDATAERRAEAESSLAAAVDRLDADVRADTWLLAAPDPTAAIVEQSAYYDVTVVGAPRTGRLRRAVYGSASGTVRREARNATVTVHRPRTDRSVLDRWF